MLALSYFQLFSSLLSIMASNNLAMFSFSTNF
jgi:hypothetical protein